jgi:N-acyl homoserine lactone hydrolase
VDSNLRLRETGGLINEVYMTEYSVDPVQTAKTIRPMNYITYLKRFGKDVEIFYGAFLISSADRCILVDTGCDAVCYSAGPMPPVEDVFSIEQALSRFEVSITDIDAVVLTHLHFDHVAFLNLFTHCPIFVQQKELRSALNPHPYFASFYVPEFFRDAKFEVVDGDIELFPGIEVALVPGHSAGAQAVIADTPEGRVAVSGFCCVAENFDRNNLAIPGIHEDVRQAYDSMQKLLGLADIIFPNHSASPVRVKNYGE